jgi:hypothetical protein
VRHLVSSKVVDSAAPTMPVSDDRKDHDKVVHHHHGAELHEDVFDADLQQRTRTQRQRRPKAISESPTLRTPASRVHATTTSTHVDDEVSPHGEHLKSRHRKSAEHYQTLQATRILDNHTPTFPHLKAKVLTIASSRVQHININSLSSKDTSVDTDMIMLPLDTYT